MEFRTPLLTALFGLLGALLSPDSGSAEPKPCPAGFAGISHRPAEKAALDTLANIEAYGTPPQHGQNPALYNRYLKYRNDPTFLATLKKHPDAWKVFERSRLSVPEQTALDLVDDLVAHGAMPDNDRNRALYVRVVRDRDDAAFRAKLQQNPHAWKIFQRSLWTPTERAAHETLEYIQAHRTVPRHRDDRAFYNRYLKHRDDPVFRAILKEDPDAWAVFEKPPRRPKN